MAKCNQLIFALWRVKFPYITWPGTQPEQGKPTWVNRQGWKKFSCALNTYTYAPSAGYRLKIVRQTMKMHPKGRICHSIYSACKASFAKRCKKFKTFWEDNTSDLPSAQYLWSIAPTEVKYGYAPVYTAWRDSIQLSTHLPYSTMYLVWYIQHSWTYTYMSHWK